MIPKDIENRKGRPVDKVSHCVIWNTSYLIQYNCVYFKSVSKVKFLLLLHGSLGDAGVLLVGKAAGENANVSCIVSLQPLLINYRIVWGKYKSKWGLTDSKKGTQKDKFSMGLIVAAGKQHFLSH